MRDFLFSLATTLSVPADTLLTARLLPSSALSRQTLRRLVAVPLALLPLWLAPAGAALAQTTTFNYTGSTQTYTVPAGVTQLAVVADGGAGGTTTPATNYSAPGGRVTATVTVVPGEVLTVVVGAKGTLGVLNTPTAGSYNGGGAGTGGAGAGGGATHLSRNTTATGDYLSSRNALLVAGGGGGTFATPVRAGGNGGTPNGGFGGGTSGGGGASQASPGSAGGTGTEQGNSGFNGTGGSGGSNYCGGGGGGYLGGGGGGRIQGSFGGSSGGGGGSSWVWASNSSGIAYATAPTDGIMLLTPVPVVSSVAPNPGGLGQSITLTGTNLTNVTALTINGANAFANILSNTATSVVVRVPATASASGNVSLTTAGGTATIAFAVMAPPGNALAFDGVDDYLALPAATPVPLGNTAYTVEAWVNPNSMNVGSILGWGNYGTTNQANGLSLYPTGLINYWWSNDLQKTTPSLVGRWHHVAATYDGTTRTLYLDGVALGSDVPGVHAVPNASNLRIGSNSNGAFTYLNGRLDEVRVYSVALTAAQLQADMTSTTAAVPGSLVLYYNFDQGTPATASTGANTAYTTLYDLSSNFTPGTLTTFALTSGNTTSNYVESYALVVPTATAASGITGTGFTANWTAPAVGTVTNYLLDYSASATFASGVTTLSPAAGATSQAISGLANNTTYYYRIRADKTSVTGQGAYSATGSATTLALPAITSFSPTSGLAGTSVVLTGTNLTGASSVSVNGVAVTPTGVSGTSLTFVVPAGASSVQSITVTTPGGTSAASPAFTVLLQVASTNPAANAHTAPTANSATDVTFTEPVTAAAAASLKVFSAQLGGKKAGTVTVAGSTASFAATASTPRTNFKAGETVSVTVPASVTNANGLPATKRVYQFTTAAGGTGQGNFQPGSTTAVTSISDVVAADFNGDGILDLADNGSGLEVRFGTGGGSYGAATVYAGFTAGQVNGLTAGDLDNDGDLDLVVARSAGTLGVLQNDGTGAFTALADAASNGSSPRKPALGDLDGDGDLDLLVALSSGTGVVGVYLNNGSGGFAAPTSVSVIGSAGSANSTYVALGDLDNDGDLDFAATDFNNARVVVRLNNGSGGFAAGSDVAVGTQPNAVALADVNGDNSLDILTSNIGVAALSVSLNNNNGTGSFATSIAYTLPATSAGLAVGDVDADGDLDVVTGSNQNAFTGFYLVLNNGSGSFGTASNIAASDKMYYLALADLDNDGDLDLAGAAGNGGFLFVRLNQPTPTISSISPNPGVRGEAVTVTGTNLSGVTAVSVNGVAATTASFVNNTATSLTFRVPATAGASGTTTLTTAVGPVSTTTFTTVAATPPGNALAFDGVDDYVGFGSPAGLSNLGLGSFTVEAWVYCTNAGPVNSLIRKAGDYNLFLRPGGLLNLEVWSGGMGNSTRPYNQATVAVPVNRWTHVAGTWNGTTIVLFVNGVDVSGTQTSSPITTSEPLQLGRSAAFNEPLNGRMDEVRIYNAALTAANIQADMRSTASAVPASLKLYLNFDQAADTPGGNNTGQTILYDQTASAFAGTLTNFALTGTTSNWVESYALVVPTATAATSVSNNTFTANWTAPAVGTVTNYLVDVSASSTFASAVSGSPFTLPVGATSLTVGSLPGGTYYYRVRADKTSVTGQGDYSNVITVVVPSATLSCSAGANNALNFDGGSDYVHSASTLPATGEFTLETWVNPTTLPGGFSGLLLSDNFPAGAMHWQFNGSTLEFTVNGSAPSDQFASFTVPTSSWSHVAVVYSASAKTAKFYLNGALQNTATYTTAAAVGAQTYSVGGWLSGGPQRFLNGSLNELRVWSVARTDAQVLASYNQALPAQTGLAILYSFDQGVAGGTNPSVTTLNDDSGTGHTGTLNTFALTGATSNWVAGNTLAYTLGLTSFSPGSGAAGVPVTLSGSGFTGATAVAFNGTAASFTVANGSTITTTVPTGATSGPITVTGPCGTVTSGSSFTVCALPVAIAQNVTVTLDVNGNAATTAPAVNNGSTANCGVAAAGSLSLSQSNFSCTDAVPATVASALSFNGTTQYVEGTNANLPLGNAARTIEAWVYPTAAGANGAIFNYGTPSTNLRAGILLIGGKLYYVGENNDLSGNIALTVNAWSHVAATYDGSTLKLYVNGVLDVQANPGAFNTTGTIWRIAQRSAPQTGEFLTGRVDEVRVWNVARTPAQIAANKNVGLPGASAGLVAYYRLNEGSGTTTADATASASTGTLYNSPTWTSSAPPVVNGSLVTLTVTDAGGNTSTASAVVTVSVPATPTTTWNGSLSTSPLACQNWSYGQVPDAATNAVIPTGLPLYPTLAAGTLATKDLTINNSGSFTTNGGTTLQVNGSLTNSGTATFSGPVQFVGSAATQTLSHGGGFTSVTVNKPTGTVQLAQNLTINSGLTLTSGTLTTTGSYQVNLGGSATLSESDASYVLGKVVVSRTLTPGTAEPFAGLGLTLTPAAGSTAPGATQVTRTTGTAIAGAGTSQSILRYFDIQPATNTGLNVTMNFAYFTHELNGIAVANLAMFKSVSGSAPWIPQRGTTAAGSVVTKTGITDFSIWTLGNSANPLPVELAAFTATAEGNRTVRLAWATASEKNSAVFEVERSLSGTGFARIGTVAAAGSSSSARSYDLLDAQLPGDAAVLYYRLKQVDADGSFSYSPVRAVALKGAATGLSLYPNPTHSGGVTLTGSRPGTVVTVYDALGRLVTSAPADAAGTAALALPAGLPTGVYVVRAGTQALRLTVE